MPVYEYHCRKCATKFELMRAMSSSDAPATCPQGHAGAQRTLSMFAAVSKSGGGDPMPMPTSGGCGCGGGSCGCGGH